MKHEDFRQDRRHMVVGETLEIIESQLLPSLIAMIQAAAADTRSYGRRAGELRSLAGDLERLRTLVEDPGSAQRSRDGSSSIEAK